MILTLILKKKYEMCSLLILSIDWKGTSSFGWAKRGARARWASLSPRNETFFIL